MLYAAGYIPRALHKRLKSSFHPLKEDDDEESEDWIDLIDRGDYSTFQTPCIVSWWRWRKNHLIKPIDNIKLKKECTKIVKLDVNGLLNFDEINVHAANEETVTFLRVYIWSCYNHLLIICLGIIKICNHPVGSEDVSHLMVMT